MVHTEVERDVENHTELPAAPMPTAAHAVELSDQIAALRSARTLAEVDATIAAFAPQLEEARARLAQFEAVQGLDGARDVLRGRIAACEREAGEAVERLTPRESSETEGQRHDREARERFHREIERSAAETSGERMTLVVDHPNDRHAPLVKLNGQPVLLNGGDIVNWTASMVATARAQGLRLTTVRDFYVRRACEAAQRDGVPAELVAAAFPEVT